ncbi:conserved hypothetical protein [Theileria equi strain WA]|uniref:RING-type domain-containing protein n=1 Tax=Theileria equi strain WA TaxID=1537102 RepID=L1LEZ4_THEEQ|nr:conserved hypothetical protein [Theileria equi strain WA]EKX73921.1 conserved hypothetical protein [Theileria equi strain WA]|eukprot:XP_004833373.1 conserved hypothetical protein [Theileria equi strain WA]
MEENWRGGNARQVRGRYGGDYRRNRPPGMIIGPDLHRSFSDGLCDVTFDTFLSCGLPHDRGLNKAQLQKLLAFKPTRNLSSFLNCCICYENTLICAVGKCDHIICLLCALKLFYFYSKETPFGYECPYCKHGNEALYFCANPFYVHLASNKAFYSSKGSFALTQEELQDFVSILRRGSNDEEYYASGKVNITELYELFLQYNADVVKRLESLGTEHCVESCSITKSNETLLVNDDCVMIRDKGLIFESSGIYHLCRLITTPLCWIPECRKKWLSTGIDGSRFGSLKLLSKHLKAEHNYVICDICAQYFADKKFVPEMLLYHATRIADHVKNGDFRCYPPISPHVSCPACKIYHWDKAMFKKHAKEEHFICDLCDSGEVFSHYSSLFEHYKTYHYPCEEQDCMFVVFSDDLQLRLHYVAKHPQVTRIPCHKKPLATARREDASPVSRTSAPMFDELTTDLAWDGFISIIGTESQSETLEEVLEKESPLYPYFVSTVIPDDQLKVALDPICAARMEMFLKRNVNALEEVQEVHSEFGTTEKEHVELNMRVYKIIESKFRESYKACTADCTKDASKTTALFNLVKEYIAKLVFLCGAEKGGLKKRLLNCLHDTAQISNGILVKSALEQLIGDMKEVVSARPLSLTRAMKLQGNLRNPLPAQILNPKADTKAAVGKKKKIVKWERKKEEQPKVEKVVAPHPVVEKEKVIEPAYVTNLPDTSTLFINHVNSNNFYGLMYDVIGQVLRSNMEKYSKNQEYTLRDTTKSKLANIALSQKRCFTNLGEFMSMKKLESLQALEPEFHRLVRDLKNVQDLAEIAQAWTKRCLGILKNMQVEHLEIIHYYLKGNCQISLPLCNDAEFPILVKHAKGFTENRNYANALGARPGPRFQNELDFPTLGETSRRR